MLNVIYAAIVVNYSFQCRLLAFYIDCIAERIEQNRLIDPFNAMKVISLTYTIWIVST